MNIVDEIPIGNLKVITGEEIEKTTTIAVIRETGVYRGPIEGPPQTSQAITALWYWGGLRVLGGSQLFRHSIEKRQPLGQRM